MTQLDVDRSMMAADWFLEFRAAHNMASAKACSKQSFAFLFAYICAFVQMLCVVMPSNTC